MLTRKIWLLKLVLPISHGRILTGLLLLSFLLPFFYLGVNDLSEETSPALFFSLIIAYIIPVFSFITARSQEELAELRLLLDLDDLGFEQARTRLDSATVFAATCWLVVGAFCGCAHMIFIRGSVGEAVSSTMSSMPGFLSTLGAVMVWMIMTTVVAMLIRQSLLFGHLGANKARISLLNTRPLLPFARVSIISSLAMIGALSFFPLISLDSGLNLAESLPGVLALLVPLIIMFTIPVWPLHRRLLAKKEQELVALNNRIEACLDTDGGVDLDSANLKQLTPLLEYRREIVQASTWPFDLGNMTTLAFYLIIPPLTWAGAALIENLVDSLL